MKLHLKNWLNHLISIWIWFQNFNNCHNRKSKVFSENKERKKKFLEWDLNSWLIKTGLGAVIRRTISTKKNHSISLSFYATISRLRHHKVKLLILGRTSSIKLEKCSKCLNTSLSSNDFRGNLQNTVSVIYRPGSQTTDGPRAGEIKAVNQLNLL